MLTRRQNSINILKCVELEDVPFLIHVEENDFQVDGKIDCLPGF